MISTFVRTRSFNRLFSIGAARRALEHQPIASETQVTIHRKMSSQSIDEKFQLPKRYQGSAPSVW